MLSVLFKFLIYTLGVLMAERQFRVTHMIYTIEAPQRIVQAPTPDPKIYIQTIYKDPPPLPHPVVSLGTHSPSANSTDGAGRYQYSQYYTSLGSYTGAIREGTLEEVEKHPEYSLQGEIDASEGRVAAKRYADKHRKRSLRSEVNAVIVYKQPPRPPPLNINWPLFICVTIFIISIILIGFGVLNIRGTHKILQQKRKYLERSRSALQLDWILRHIDLQNAYQSETSRLKAKVLRLRARVASQKARIRALTTRGIENRFRSTFCEKKVKDLANKVADLDRAFSYLKSLHDLTMAMLEPDEAFVRRFEKDAAEAEKLFWDKIRERPGKARTSPTQWWDEQRKDIELAKRFLERKAKRRNWRIDPAVEERLRRKGLLEPGAFDRPAPSKRILTRRAYVKRGEQIEKSPC